MPRASWRGFLRLSLVSCPIYLSPATRRTKPIRLHQVWQTTPVNKDEGDLAHRGERWSDSEPGGEWPGAARSPSGLRTEHIGPNGHQDLAATRITLRPHDPGTGEEIDKREVVRGYEYDRGQFVTFTAEELKALDVESSKVIALEKFAPHGEIDPVYLESPYYVYPDGPIAVEALRVIGAAMAQAGVVGLGRLTLSRRERMVMVDPRGAGMALFTLRAADEVRTPKLGGTEGDLDPEMVAIASAIIRQRSGHFDPSTYRDRYQEALQQLIEAKLQGLTIKPVVVSTPSPVIDLMAALKRSLAQESPATDNTTGKEKRAKPSPDRRQRSLLLPVTGSRKKKQNTGAEPAAIPLRPRKKA
jgi:DNA end-binding protein Ku